MKELILILMLVGLSLILSAAHRDVVDMVLAVALFVGAVYVAKRRDWF